MRKIRVCIVDDSVTMRAMLGHMLDEERGIEVVGVVADTSETYAFIRRTRPDVVTIDGTLEEDAHFHLLDQLMAEWPLPVVALTATSDGDCVGGRLAMHHGAVACIAKRDVGLDPAALVRLVKKAATLKPRLRKDAVFA